MVSSRDEPQWKGGEMKGGQYMQMVSSMNESQCLVVDKKAGWCGGGMVSSKNDPTDGRKSKNEMCEGMVSFGYETQWTGRDKNGCLVG